MVINVFCLLIWIYWLIHGIYCCVKDEEVSKVGFICAVIIAILYYLDKIIT